MRVRRSTNGAAREAALRYVDRLIADAPATLVVPISALPGTERDLLRLYKRSFRLRGYRLDELSKEAEGPVARFTKYPRKDTIDRGRDLT